MKAKRKTSKKSPIRRAKKAKTAEVVRYQSPTEVPADISARRATQAAARREQTKSGQDIGDIPECVNPERREAGRGSFKFFCETYLPKIFNLEWSKDHLRVIAKIEAVVVNHDMMAIAMPRGSGKSSLCRAAVLWATLHAMHRYSLLVGATASDAARALMWFKAELGENELLNEDFPEVCFPIRALENETRRCLGQRYKGEKTNIRWGKDHLVLPTIPQGAASGSVIDVASLEGAIRGRWVRTPDGKIVRPTLVLPDDPQTAETARSQGPNGQTAYRLKTLTQDIQGLAGPDQQTAILVPCTVIEAGDLSDQILDRKLHPEFRGERTKRLYSWPTNKALWEEYRELREHAMENDLPLDESVEFYRSRMCNQGRKLDEAGACGDCPHKANCMDCGAVVDWTARLDDPRNLSAVQAAMHAFYKFGAAGFAAEFQNDPLANAGGDVVLTAAMCQMRYSGRTQREVPLECTELTMGVDVQQSCLFYVVAAWRPDFTGHIIDYGVWPRQTRRVFTLQEIADGPASLQTAYPGRGVEATIQAGLEEFIARSLATDYVRAGGGLMRLGRVLVDSGKWDGTIAAVKQKVGGSTMMLSKGVGIRAGTAPMSARKRKPGERMGDHWRMPNVQGTREFPHVAIDTNYWKAFVHEAFLTAPGDPGAMTLFGAAPDIHALFASHITAETYTKTHGHGRDVQEWTIKPQRPDNHWFDALVYSACAASVQGVTVPNRKEPPRVGVVRRKRVSIDELLARRERKDEAA